MLTSFFHASLIIGLLVTLLWIYSVIITNVSIVDIFWGMGFVIVNTFFFMTTENPSDRQIIVLVLVAIWGLRLSAYLGWRNYGKAEDYRYQEFRQRYGADRYWWFSFFQVFLLQGASILVVSLPLLAIHHSSSALKILDFFAIIVWFVGFIFEAVGDYQLARFKKDSTNKGKVMNTGLWKYTRHPNYFGDATVWTAYALFCISYSL